MLTYRVVNNNYYIKPVQANFLLLDLMKESGIQNPVSEYINRWKGKHPTPYDFFFTMEDLIGEDLSWFWNPWFFEFGYPDLAIKEVNQTSSCLEILIEKKGNQPVPVHLDITYSENLTETENESMRIWMDGKKEHRMIIETDMKALKIVLGNEEIPDVNPLDNIWKR
jgi:aminopeptidase N